MTQTLCSLSQAKNGVLTLICCDSLPQRSRVTNRHIARAKLRSPTSVASVATKGGSRIAVISQVWSVPTSRPERRAAAIAAAIPAGPTVTSRRSSGAEQSVSTRAQVVALKATMEPAERSMPPAMITTAEPRAMMPSSAVFRRMMSRLSAQLAK